jgi:TPR repeat protein
MSPADISKPEVSPETSQSSSASQKKPEITELRAKAESGDIGAQLALANAYDTGDGVSQSDDLAAKWYHKAAEQGNSEAQNILGNLYRAGRGVERDKSLALKWYRKATLQRNSRAMFNLATAYYNGDGVAIDDSKAFAWFTLALESGSKNADEAVKRMKSEIAPWRITEAFKYVASMYENGVEVPRDLNQAVQWYRRAAARGDRDAQISLAIVLLNGHGVPQDFTEGRKWCEAAAKQKVNIA